MGGRSSRELGHAPKWLAMGWLHSSQPIAEKRPSAGLRAAAPACLPRRGAWAYHDLAVSVGRPAEEDRRKDGRAMRIAVNYQDEHLDFEIADDRVIGHRSGPDRDATPDVRAMTLRALEAPSD